MIAQVPDPCMQNHFENDAVPHILQQCPAFTMNEQFEPAERLTIPDIETDMSCNLRASVPSQV
jgi:hypothetical protein